MGVPTEDSPSGQYTVLSKVSTAAPSTQGSLDTINTESRHALRGKQSQGVLDRLGGDGDGGRDGESGGRRGGNNEPPEEEEEEEQYEGPMDPEEEGDGYANTQKSSQLEPPGEDALESSLEEVVESNDAYNNQSFDASDEGDGGMQLNTQQFDDNDNDVHFDGGNDGGFDNDFEEEDAHDNNEEDDAISAKTSQKSRASSKESSKVSSAKPSPEESEEEEEPPKKQKSKKGKKHQQQSADVTPTSVLRTKKSKKKKQTNNRVNWSTPNGTSKGIPAGNREYEAIPVSDYKADYPEGEEPQTPGGSALRRSRRAKFSPLAYWKNEKVIYEAQNEKGLLGDAMGDMPVVAGVMHALPTPYKEVTRKEPATKKAMDKKKKRKRGDDSDDDDDETTLSKVPFDDKAIRKKFRIQNGESGSVWSETLESATDIKIVSRIDNRNFSKLPLSSTRKKRESKVVGFASQSFHVPTDDDDLFPGYIAGNVVLPPRGIKDAEGVGLCSQVFNVGDCQPNSLEFALADPSGQDGEFDPKTAQRYLLNKGDMFQIPPGNVYRIENHSKTVKATLFWTIIKCTSRAEQDDDSEEDD